MVRRAARGRYVAAMSFFPAGEGYTVTSPSDRGVKFIFENKTFLERIEKHEKFFRMLNRMKWVNEVLGYEK